ncbi:MAG: 50S ribosomal protein L28 [Chloroflexi bacterium RBG_16_63_12]|jgi:large subunit ribosomal protein L28|nr:large subunit ribosomal protein L28 [Anaerolineales bacterium]MBM2848951.1 large subunit ribosomal protein [Anaerolineales bacterium]OGO45436.1 MAG: 50S ribosomal protein L28 [Chloroflexi bacterium RBG_16_63_12]
MAKCDNCGKAPVFGNNVSHAKNRTPRLFRPNLQKVSILDAKRGRRVQKMLCAKCIKSLSKIK